MNKSQWRILRFRFTNHAPRFSTASLLLAAALFLVAACKDRPWPPNVQEVAGTSPVLSPEEALKSFYLPPGYKLELVAAEPLVQDPIAIDFDAEGRMYVVEMRGYMPNLEGEGEERPVGRIVVLEDTDDDGRMDRKTVYLDSLVLPRAVKVLAHGVLVGAPPHLWLTRDANGDLKADTREVVRDDYGDPESNPEHNANGLLWGPDNWIHNAKYGGQLRSRGGRIDYRETPPLGQWGLSMDDYGRIYRNYNEDPLHVDLLLSHYLGRNPALTRRRGVYEELTENGPVWPVRPTPGVNRGYREKTLRRDSTLAHFTAAGSPVAYRGDRLPNEFLNNVFVTEPAGNLVRRFVVREMPDGTLSAHNAYDGAEFLASTDERFRPVNVYSAPDGTLYIVDMYRGIIQHRYYITDYLAEQIRARKLEQPVGMGRIYRVVHKSTHRGKRPMLSQKSAVELVDILLHPNGWWRSMAQQLLVERGDRSVAPALRRLALSARDERTRLHALWTLDGLGAADPHTLGSALDDDSPHVRAAAIRLSEPHLQSTPGLRAAVMKRLEEATPMVRWQLVASLGELPEPERLDALAAALSRYGNDPILVDVAISGSQGQELAVLERLLSGMLPGPREAVRTLAATVIRAGREAEIDRLLSWIGDASRSSSQRLALLEGVEEIIPESDNQGDAVNALRFHRKPSGLLVAASSPDTTVRTRAERIVRFSDWPGKPRPPGSTGVRPLTPEEQRQFENGKRQYMASCAPCHQTNGRGMPGVAKSLVGSRWVVGRPEQLIRIVLHGKEGEMLMPSMGTSLSEEQIAAILTYIRREWGNQASAISPVNVQEIRGYTANRNRPWTEKELAEVRR